MQPADQMIVQGMEQESQLREQRMIVITNVGHESFRPPRMPACCAQIEPLVGVETIVFGVGGNCPANVAEWAARRRPAQFTATADAQSAAQHGSGVLPVVAVELICVRTHRGSAAVDGLEAHRCLARIGKAETVYTGACQRYGAL